MSRALNIDASEAEIMASCASAGIVISMIERLQSGGTRVVLNNAVDAKAVARTYRLKLLTGEVTRLAIFAHRRPGRGGAPQWPR
jgi:hypothetical protein